MENGKDVESEVKAENAKNGENVEKDVIKNGDRCVIGLNDIYKVMIVKKGKQASYEKHKFDWDSCIGQQWGRTWKIIKHKLVPLSAEEVCGESVVTKVLADVDAGEDNRNAQDRAQAGQGISRDELMSMKGEKHGDAVITELVQNNVNFEAKSRFTQEKFVRHKQKKHGGRLRIMKPSLKLLSTQMLSRDQKASIMEVQQLATILNYANVHANANVLLVESTAGLLTGAIMSRLQSGSGSLVNIFNGQIGDSPPLHGASLYNFDDATWNKLFFYPSKSLGKAALENIFDLPNLDDIEGETEPPRTKKPKLDGLSKEEILKIRKDRRLKRLSKYTKAVDLLKEKLDSLVISVRHHPLPWLFILLRFIKPSRPIVIYCDRQEPLMECYLKLHEMKRAVMLSINTVFERRIQVLPERTHPEVQMPGNRGFVLYGITVDE